MLRFPYLDEPLTGTAPPSLPAGAAVRWRPLVPISIIGPGGLTWDFGRAVLDPAADDTVFPLDTAGRIGARLHPDTGHRVRWRGQLYALRFADVELLLTDNVGTWRWAAVVAFSPAPLRYPILGQSGCLQFMDARFFGLDLIVELATNRSFAGTET
jgi:hypothetical protein